MAVSYLCKIDRDAAAVNLLENHWNLFEYHSICFSINVLSKGRLLGVQICQAYDVAEFCRNVHSCPEWQEAATQSCIALGGEGGCCSVLFNKPEMYARHEGAHSGGIVQPKLRSSTRMRASTAHS